MFKLFLFESKVNVYKDIDGIVDYNREIAENILKKHTSSEWFSLGNETIVIPYFL